MAERVPIRKVPDVGRIHDVKLELRDPVPDSRYHVQYADSSGHLFQITVPIRQAFRLMDILKESSGDLLEESAGE